MQRKMTMIPLKKRKYNTCCLVVFDFLQKTFYLSSYINSVRGRKKRTLKQ